MSYIDAFKTHCYHNDLDYVSRGELTNDYTVVITATDVLSYILNEYHLSDFH